MAVHVLWFWEMKDPRRRSGWRKLSWRMTDETAATWAKTHGAELRKIEGSKEVRRDLGQPHIN